MTARERGDLIDLIKRRAQVAKDDAEARGKFLLADVETKLAAI
jgi:hypothetical protein